MFLLAGRYFYAPSISRCELWLGIVHELHLVIIDGGSVWTLLLTHPGKSI